MEKDDKTKRTKDRVRGSLMAGAAGDALGLPVEFMSSSDILAHYGSKGITKFELSSEGKALVSCDTQLVLFSANGMLIGVTRGYTRGIGGQPESYVGFAYSDLYCMQTRKNTDSYHYTWLRDLPEVVRNSSPSTTFVRAYECLLKGENVKSDIKGFGGIMCATPMALLMAGYWSRGKSPYDKAQMDEAGCEVVILTHKDPKNFLPAAMLTHLIYQLIKTDASEIKSDIASIALESTSALDLVYKDKYAKEKRYLAELTRKAISLAKGSESDAENISLLGEGWTGAETWAVALYCAVRHAGSMRMP